MGRKRIVILYLFLLGLAGNPCFARIDSLEYLLKGNLSEIDRVDLLNTISEDYQYIDLDKMLEYAEEALELSENIRYRRGVAMAKNNMGTFYRLKGGYSKAIDLYFSSLEIMEELGDEKGIARCYNLIGILYFTLENYELSLDYYSRALEMNFKQNDKKWIAGNSNNIGMVYERLGDYEKASEYYFKSLEMNLELGINNWIANNYGNIGNLYLLMGKPESIDYFWKRFQINEAHHDTNGMAISLSFIGRYFIQNDNPREAIPYLLRANEYAASEHSLSLENRVTRLLGRAYAAQSDFQSALTYEKLNKEYNDSLRLHDNTEKITRLQMQYRHRKDQQTEELKLRNSESFQTAVAVILFFILVFTFLLFNRQRILTRQHEMEQSNLELENNLLQEELDFKGKMLQDNIKYLLDINDLLTGTIDKFNNLRLSSKPENRHVLKDIINTLQSGVNDEIWKEFEVRFNQVHRNFYNKINELFPDLTSNEKKLCAFLKLNMTSKEISHITSMNIKSIETARSRLRKKLNIKEKSISLSEFLENL